jgi:hypothetical protein
MALWLALYSLANLTHLNSEPPYVPLPLLPLSETVCGLFGASSVTVNSPGRDPRDLGVNVTLTLQWPPTHGFSDRCSLIE